MTDGIQQFNYNVDLLKAILWQYNDAANLQSLLEQKKAWYDANQTEFWQDWYTNVFDLRTCNDFGLTVWSIILGLNLYVNFVGSGRETWGFEQYHLNFENGNFGTTTGSTARLSTASARTILRLRYYQLTGSGTTPEINRIIADVFAPYVPAGDSPGYVEDNEDMTITYQFLFQLPTELQYALNYFDVLPRPTGVESSIVVTP